MGTAGEKDYVLQNCSGIVEYRLPDLTRVDCLTLEVAWEYEWAQNWYEAIGQALHYAMWTGREGGVALITAPEQQRFVERARRLIAHYRLPLRLKRIDK